MPTPTATPSVRQALAWSFAERYAGLLISVVSTMVLARLLSPAEVGVFSLCAAFTAIITILRDFGISEYLIQEKVLGRARLQAAYGLALLSAWSMAGLILLLRGSLARYYAEPGLADVLAVLSLSFVLLPFASPAFALLNRKLAFRKICAIQTACNLLHALTAIGLAHAGYSFMSLAWAPLASIALQVLLLLWLRPRDTLLLPRFRGMLPVARFGLMLVGSRLIETVTRNAHEFLIARQFGFGAVGLFSRAFGLIELFFNNVTTAMLRVASPGFAAEHRAGRPLAERFAQGTALFTAVGFPFLGFVALMAPDIITLLFGPQWQAAAPIASVLALALLPGYLVALGPNLLAASGHVGQRLQISLCYSAVHLVGLLLAAHYSLLAMAVVWAVSNLVMLALYAQQLRRILAQPAYRLFRPSLSSLALAGLTIGSQWLLCHAAQQAGWPGPLRLALVCAGGLLVWLGAVHLLHHPIAAELGRLWRHLHFSKQHNQA